MIASTNLQLLTPHVLTFLLFSSFFRIDSAIKDTCMILDKKINGILHLGSKTLTKAFFLNESNNRKPKPIFDMTSRHVNFKPFINEYLEEDPIYSFEFKQDDHDSCDSDIDIHLIHQLLEDESDIDHHFSYQLLEDEPKDDKIQSSKILGRICDQYLQFNVFLTPSK